MRALKGITFALLLLTFGLEVHAAGQHAWLKKPYSRFSNEDSVKNFLEKMSASIGIPGIVSDQVKGSISGNLKKKNVGEILDMMNHVYSVVWYYDGANIYYYHSSEVSMTLMDFGGADAEFVKQQLETAGIWDNRFRWRSVQGYSAAYVSGPQRLKDLVLEFAQLINAKKIETNRLLREAVVVPLKYLKAEDEDVALEGESRVVQGLVSTLRDLVYDRKQAEIVQEFSGGGEETSEIKEKALNSLKRDLSRGIKAHRTQNAVVLLDSPENIELYRSLISQLDVPSEQVEIDVTIIDVLTDSISELGFDWSSIGNTGALTLSEGLSADLINSRDGIAQVASAFTSPEDIFRLRLEALAADGEANILSQPSIVTLNNQPASIDNTESFFIKLEGEDAVSLEEVVVGSRLVVTPRIFEEGRDRSVHLDIYLEDGQRTGDDVDQLPVIRQTKIKTKSVVRSHGSLLVGGYYVERTENANTGVPILKDIPLLGRAFRTERKSKGKLVRMFLLTPKLARVGDMVAGMETRSTLKRVESERVTIANTTPMQGISDEKARIQAGIPEGRQLDNEFVIYDAAPVE